MDILNRICVTSVENTMTVSSATGRFEQITNRKYYGLSFCLGGQITYYHNGIKYVSDKDHAVILPQNQSYYLFGDKKGIFPVINFKCADFLCDTFVVLPISNVDAFLKDYEQMRSLVLFDKDRAKVMSLFYDIIHKLSVQSGSQTDLLRPAIRYLENNFSKPLLTNEILAAECNISEVYFRKLFTEQYGVSPRQYIVDVRIEKAKQLLRDGVLKIAVISERCGFSNPFHFSRAFKEKVGITPTEYMKQNKNTKI